MGRNATRIWLYQENEEWIAEAEQYGLVGTGKTKEEAIKELRENVCVQLETAAEEIRKQGLSRVYFLYKLEKGDIKEIKQKGGILYED